MNDVERAQESRQSTGGAFPGTLSPDPWDFSHDGPQEGRIGQLEIGKGGKPEPPAPPSATRSGAPVASQQSRILLTGIDRISRFKHNQTEIRLDSDNYLLVTFFHEATRRGGLIVARQRLLARNGTIEPRNQA